MSNIKTNLFDLEEGDKFEWHGHVYEIVRWEDDDQTAIVKERGIPYETRFNPYATVEVVHDD